MGIDKFLEQQYKKYRCSMCDCLISIHNRKCFKCDTINKLVEKYKEMPNAYKTTYR